MAVTGRGTNRITFRTAVPARSPRLAALTLALREVIGRSSFRRLDDLGSRVGLSRQRLSELVRGHTVPSWPDVAQVLRGCGAGQDDADRIGHLHQSAVLEYNATMVSTEVRTGQLAGRAVVGSDGLLPIVVTFTGWRELGVRKPFTRFGTGVDLTAEVEQGRLPAYVPRDVDDRLRAALSDGLVVVTGPSTSGKTRTAFEAVRAELGAWQLLIPTGVGALTALLDESFDFRHVVVWLDEVQEIIEQPGGVEQLRRLLALPRAPRIVATIGAAAEDRLRGTAGGRFLETRGARFELPRQLRPAELARAEKARSDPWVADLVTSGEVSIAQHVAAGDQLVRHLEVAGTSQPLAVAVFAAAVDCHRAGYRGPVQAPLLFDLHHHYLPGSQDTNPAAFDAALRWLRTSVCGAAGLFVHTRGLGDEVSGYVLNHHTRTAPPMPDHVWQVVQRHATPRVLISLTLAARQHGRRDVAAEYLRRAAAPGLGLAELLYQLGDEDSLRTHADSGDRVAAIRLTHMLLDRADEDELIRRADGGDRMAAHGLALLYLIRGDEDALALRAETGDMIAARRLARYRLSPDGPPPRARSRAGFTTTSILGGEMLSMPYETGLRYRADRGDQVAAKRLVQLLVARGDEVEVRQRALSGDVEAGAALSRLLTDRGDEQELVRNADAGEPAALAALAGLLCDRGDVDELRARADRGDRVAAEHLARLLAARGDARELERRASRGDTWAGAAAAHLAAAGENQSDLARMARDGNTTARHLLAGMLQRRHDDPELEARAAGGDTAAHRALVHLLIEDGDEDKLAERARAGDTRAAAALAHLLAARGDKDSLFDRAHLGDSTAVTLWLARCVPGEDDDRLWRLVEQGHSAAKQQMEWLLVRNHDAPGLFRLLDTGWPSAAQALDAIVYSVDDVDDLWAIVGLGSERAAVRLAQYYTRKRNAAGLLRARACGVLSDTGFQQVVNTAAASRGRSLEFLAQHDWPFAEDTLRERKTKRSAAGDPDLGDA